jgi:hypothetical protein
MNYDTAVALFLVLQLTIAAALAVAVLSTLVTR